MDYDGPVNKTCYQKSQFDRFQKPFFKTKLMKDDVKQILMKSQFTKQKNIKHHFFPLTESFKICIS